MAERQEEILEIKLERYFHWPEDRFRAVEILAAYGRESYEYEVIRVRLAIIKLAGPDLDCISTYTAAAKADYRDVLAWAEYPGQMAEPLATGEARKALEDADRRQYDAWLAE